MSLKFLSAKLHFLFQRLKEHISLLQVKFASALNKRWILEDENFIRFLSIHQSNLTKKKQDFLNGIRQDQKTIFFVFRDLHLIDWFIPIHRALDENFSNKFAVVYVNFGSTLQKVGDGLSYLPYLNKINQRLNASQNAIAQHFSDQEISLFNKFPKPDLILTTETIRQEKFQTNQRIYLPHYTVPKAGDTLPGKIKYNHVFLPTTQEFSYQSESNRQVEDVIFHQIGYPKMNALPTGKIKLFENDNPTVIFAPSLDIKLIQSFINQGILGIFKSLKEYNFILKLHPTLSTKMHYLYAYLCKELKGYEHIRIDTKSNLQEIGINSNLMISDFGSVGAEYRMSFGKRIIYLKLPERFEGGADLRFRDLFADSVSKVRDLEKSISDLLKTGDLSISELEEMRHRVLYNWQDADKKAAEAIYKILE